MSFLLVRDIAKSWLARIPNCYVATDCLSFYDRGLMAYLKPFLTM